MKQVSLCDDKNYQSTKCIHMWLVKSAMKSSHMWSVRPAMFQSSYKKHNYEECQVRPVSMCDDKNCQSARCAHMQSVKPAMPQSSYKKCSKSAVIQSTPLSKDARKQIGTQPEVSRNCQDSTNKHWQPPVSTVCVSRYCKDAT